MATDERRAYPDARKFLCQISLPVLEEEEMRALVRNTITATLALMTLCVSRPGQLWADGDGKNEEAKAKPARLETPSPLTARNGMGVAGLARRLFCVVVVVF